MSANLPISTVLKNLKLLNVSNNNIVHARHSHFSTLEKLEVLDLSGNKLHCDDGFKNLIQWLKDRKVSFTIILLLLRNTHSFAAD